MADTALQNDDFYEEDLKARKGRPRSEKSRKAILNATNKLLLQTSVQELSIESIAKKAKVGKTTIYRWWPNKTAVVMEALASQPGLQSPMPTANNHREAIIMQLDKLIRLVDSHNGQTIAQLFSEAQASSDSLKIFKDNLLEPLMDAMRYSIEEGQRNGEFRNDIDSTIVVDILCGPVFFRLMAHPKDLTDEFREDYPSEALKILSPDNAN
ncbi:MAG: TetR/AcrR family transcriptional regulator [Alphaproteobacteria bacterium]|nr:TetR/AcrR family transcriptional regulator [Alphaproteobacteria bacterium]